MASLSSKFSRLLMNFISRLMKDKPALAPILKVANKVEVKIKLFNLPSARIKSTLLFSSNKTRLI